MAKDKKGMHMMPDGRMMSDKEMREEREYMMGKRKGKKKC